MKIYRLSIRCYHPFSRNYTYHTRKMKLKDLEKWVEEYIAKHNFVEDITVKIHLTDREGSST